MNSLAMLQSPPLSALPEMRFIASDWQSRLIPAAGVVLSEGKASAGEPAVHNLGLEELNLVHVLADAINSESAPVIERIFGSFDTTFEIIEPIIPALNLELAVTGRRKKFVVVENGYFKARTFDGGIIFQRPLAK